MYHCIMYHCYISQAHINAIYACSHPYLLKMDRDHFPILYKPRALLHFHLIVQLPVNHRRMTLQSDLQGTPLYVHHHILPLQTEAHIERHNQLREDLTVEILGRGSFKFFYRYIILLNYFNRHFSTIPIKNGCLCCIDSAAVPGSMLERRLSIG